MTQPRSKSRFSSLAGLKLQSSSSIIPKYLCRCNESYLQYRMVFYTKKQSSSHSSNRFSTPRLMILLLLANTFLLAWLFDNFRLKPHNKSTHTSLKVKSNHQITHRALSCPSTRDKLASSWKRSMPMEREDETQQELRGDHSMTKMDIHVKNIGTGYTNG